MKFKEGLKVIARTLVHDAPIIETIFGSAGIVAGTLILITSADDISKVNDDIEAAKQEIKDVDNDEAGWSEMDETRRHYILRTTKEAAVGYVKATGVGVGCIVAGLILKDLSNATLARQLEATAASLAATTYSYNSYRQRVIADQGAEKDYEYYTGNGVTKTVEVDEDGTVIEKTTPVKANADAVFIEHGFIFDESNNNWTKSPEANLNFLEDCLNSINMVLMTSPTGQITENEMRRICGVEPTVAGQAAGAFYRDKDGYTQQIRYNPTAMARLINGDDPSAIIIFEYSDGRPIENDILNDTRNNWALY